MIDLEQLRRQTEKRLSPYRYRHTLGCVKAARQLAHYWGQDETLCAQAAMLHDWTKECGRDEQLKLCEEYDIIPLGLEKTAWKTLHGKTAAAIAVSRFGLAPGGAQAIACHTTGRAGMTKIDQIVYLADFIEENRDFEGVEPARKLAFEDLDEAMIYCLEFSLRDLMRRRLTIHPGTVDALNELYQKKKNR